MTDIEKVTLAMNWYRNTIPGNKAAAYQALQEFAACERLPKSKRKATGVCVVNRCDPLDEKMPEIRYNVL